MFQCTGEFKPPNWEWSIAFVFLSICFLVSITSCVTPWWMHHEEIRGRYGDGRISKSTGLWYQCKQGSSDCTRVSRVATDICDQVSTQFMWSQAMNVTCIVSLFIGLLTLLTAWWRASETILVAASACVILAILAGVATLVVFSRGVVNRDWYCGTGVTANVRYYASWYFMLFTVIISFLVVMGLMWVYWTWPPAVMVNDKPYRAVEPLKSLEPPTLVGRPAFYHCPQGVTTMRPSLDHGGYPMGTDLADPLLPRVQRAQQDFAEVPTAGFSTYGHPSPTYSSLNAMQNSQDLLTVTKLEGAKPGGRNGSIVRFGYDPPVINNR